MNRSAQLVLAVQWLSELVLAFKQLERAFYAMLQIARINGVQPAHRTAGPLRSPAQTKRFR